MNGDVPTLWTRAKAPGQQAPRDSLRHLHLTRWAAGFEKLRESSATRTKALCTRMAARAIV